MQKLTTARSFSDQVLGYHSLVDALARRYDGLHTAEYDDLYQEGMVVVIEALRNDAFPMKEAISGRMRRWVNRCAQKWMGRDEDPLLTQ